MKKIFHTLFSEKVYYPLQIIPIFIFLPFLFIVLFFFSPSDMWVFSFTLYYSISYTIYIVLLGIAKRIYLDYFIRHNALKRFQAVFMRDEVSIERVIPLGNLGSAIENWNDANFLFNFNKIFEEEITNRNLSPRTLSSRKEKKRKKRLEIIKAKIIQQLNNFQ